MTLRLLNDDFLFRRPLIDRFFDDDDFYLFDRVGDSLHRLLRQQEREREKKREVVATQNTGSPVNVNTNSNTNGNNSTHTTSDSNVVSSSESNAPHSSPSIATSSFPSLLRGATTFGFMGTDLIESDSDFHIHVDLPGVQPEDLDVSVVDKYVVLKAERKLVHEEKNDKVHSMERSYGTVQRKIRIPQNGDVDRASVKLRNGVLSISVPKKTSVAESVRKLTVNVENDA